MMFRNQCCYKMKKATIAKKQTKTNIYIYIYSFYIQVLEEFLKLYIICFSSLSI
jgi:hypothetical protein